MAPKTEAAAPMEQKVIDSEAKQMVPPNAVTLALVDHMNSKALIKKFEQAVSGKDDKHVERLVHTMTLCTQLHDMVVLKALLPMVKMLEKGGTLAQSMVEKVEKMEELLVKIDETKKHLGNKEFVSLMEEKKKACLAQFEEEEQALGMMMEELDEGTLEEAATVMESARMQAHLTPLRVVYA